MNLQVSVKRTSPIAKIPTKAHHSDAGWDMYSPINFLLYPGESRMIPMQVCFEIPAGWFGKIEDRSSLAKKGIFTAGGVIDSGYRGEVSVLIRNDGSERLDVTPGMRIAQLLVLPVPSIEMVESEELGDSLRGEKGFGSSGV